MAVRAPTGGSMVIQYEDFQPKSEWKEEDWANILLIYLPAGFQRGQTKVSYLHSTRTLRVIGERPLAYNKLSRFNQTFPVPHNCEVSKIQAKFQGGVLSITMPKATVTPTVMAIIPAIQHVPNTAGKEGGRVAKVQKAGKEGTATHSSASQKQTNGNKVEGIVSPQEKQERSLAPAANTTDRQANKKRVEKRKPTQQVREEALSSEPGESSEKRKESMMTTGSDEESGKKKKESMVIPGDDQGGATKALMQREKGKTDDYKVSGAASGAEEKLKEDVNASVAQKLKELKNVTAAAAKKTAKGLAMELRSEERQSMVNMGVAVLVVAALGAYIYYRYRSSGTGGRAED